MNKVYRVIWNHSLQCFVAASEFAKTKSKAASKVAAAIILSSVATTGFADENVIPKVVDSAMEETTTDSNTLPDLTEIAAIGAQVAAVMADNDLTLFDDTVVAETPVFTPGMGRAVGTNPVINIVVNGADAATASTGGWAISASERRTDGKGVIMAGLAAPIAMAIGSGANATGNGSVALGSFAATDTTAFGSVALGTYATTKGRAALAIGAGAYSNTASIALGGWSVATGLRANAIGVVSGAIGDDSTAIGTSSMASGLRSIALGSSPNTGSGADPVQDTTTNTNASGADSIALGTNAKASANNTLALGLNSSATLVNNLAVGANASATAANSVALGASSVANRANSVSIGGTGATRQLVNLSAGTTATDAANVSQLTPVIAALGGGSAFDNTTGAVTGPQYTLRQINATTGSSQSVSTPFSNVGDALTSLSGSLSNLSGSALRYVDSASKALIQLGGEDGTRITNLSTGELSASSTDAVNGSQLFATNNTVAANTATLVTHAADIAKNTANVSGLAGSLGGNAAVDVDGNFVAPSYSVQGQTLGTVGDALNALNGG
ncbi:ESPR-type extended signal peptide-containing protein (plasmid) [Serratia sp. L9]|uniref:ESPR-type extended signal peptide-containing protein n=1 Tax=Serratia sp. L9 TaxID=3423946 RepID=UPI003D66F3C7